MTWDEIGEDILSLLDEEEQKVLEREDVVYAVADADYMFYHGKDVEAYRLWKSIPEKDQMSLLEEAFPAKYYGL